MVATELLKLAMETDEERKARLKKMVATTQLRIALASYPGPHITVFPLEGLVTMVCACA